MGRFRIFTAVLVLLLLKSWLYFWLRKPDILPKKISTTPSAITCGEICSYGSKIKTGKYYPYLEKNVNCQNILLRMENPQSEAIYPPPEFPPSAMYNDFTQNGKCPNTSRYYRIDFRPNLRPIKRTIPGEVIQNLLQRDKDGENINAYRDSYLCRNTLHMYNQYISNKTGLVIGTRFPWLEAMLVNLNASHVTTSEYYPLYLDHPKMRVQHPTDVAKHFISGMHQPFDFAASFSSIEHSGLGRYGDPLDPFGDLEAVAQVWCMVKPGGVFFLGLPINRKQNTCELVWNAHRLYAVSRLQHVTSNWDVLHFNQHKENEPGMHAVLVLRKPFQNVAQ